MVDLSESIARTIKRLMVELKGISIGTTWLPKLYSGLSKEFNRVNDFRRKVLTATVPNENTDPDSFDDLEEKFGIDNYLGLSDEERINRIIERATGDSNGGDDWFQDQLQQAGFLLYVIPNSLKPTMVNQYGDIQYSSSIQYGQSASRTDPRDIPGVLICSSPPRRGGAAYLTQYGSLQYGSTLLYGTLNPEYSYPQPIDFKVPDDPARWKQFFFLSPFADRLATSEGELLSLTNEQFRYFRKLVIRTKYLRDWCIAQVRVI